MTHPNQPRRDGRDGARPQEGTWAHGATGAPAAAHPAHGEARPQGGAPLPRDGSPYPHAGGPYAGSPYPHAEGPYARPAGAPPAWTTDFPARATA
ncbi:hypothetical protein ABZ371_15070, partial [Streptomyces sp. NPDC005899]